MALDWRGDDLKRRVEKAQKRAVDATMAAAVLHAKSGHSGGAHGGPTGASFRQLSAFSQGTVPIMGPFVSTGRRFITRTSDLERSIRITGPAKRDRGAVAGRWGSKGVIYARRIELGFQGKDAAGRVVDAPAYPYLRPAAQAEYPKLAKRIRRAL